MSAEKVALSKFAEIGWSPPPCFAIGNSDGEIKIVILAPLLGDAKAMAKKFAEIQGDYLIMYPELGRLWKSVYLNRSQW